MNKILKMLAIVAIVSFVFSSCGTPPPAPPAEKPAPVMEDPKPEPEPAPAQEAAPMAEEPMDVPVKEYIVVAGDTLSQIALKFYGTREKAYYFPIIMTVTPGVIKHPDKLTPKMKLLIPDFELFMKHSASKEKSKPDFEKCIKIYEDEGRSGVAQSLRMRVQKF
ncbi:LysM peptidoglycan-binding domain-containing protein [Treponema pedis]|uniref:LysM peptidoglycan-binding domain-containing protein n=1 Tax=Treponema pedis TaxID=409322 RepID=UPI0003F77C33|nr:LysM peptidoglycan-binding domain-containing protein [Treponema pedis]